MAAMVSTLAVFDEWGRRDMRRTSSAFRCCVPLLWRKNKTSGTTRVLCTLQAPELLLLPIQECIAKMREAIGISSAEEEEESTKRHITVTGQQWFLDMKGDYRFSWCNDGRFHERFQGQNVTVEWAHDGDKAWYADFAGRVTQLQLDSFELCLLTAWIRTGFWLTETGQSKLIIEHRIDAKDLPLAKTGQMQAFEVRIKELNKVAACVVVDTKSWLPLRLVTKVCGGMETWGYSDWKILQPDCLLQIPFSVAHITASGGIDSIFVTSSCVEEVSQEAGCEFAMPSARVIARGNVYPYAQFDTTVSPHVNFYQTESGHSLVRPLVDGQDIGYFIVDSGASGFTIAAEQSKKLDMEGFGEVYLLGVENRVKSRFVRGKEFQLGGLKIKNPVFIEASVGSIAKGMEPVVGICGFDLFFHCVVEMSMGEGRMSMFEPEDYVSSHNLQWQEMYLLDNVPHVPSKINGQNAVLLLDTGAGGADVILHARAAGELGLVREEDRLQWGSVKGLHALSSASGLQAGVKELDTVEVGGLVFQQPKCLLLPHQSGNLDFSFYTSGLLCGHLLRSCLVVLDYQNTRFALVRLRGSS